MNRHRRFGSILVYDNGNGAAVPQADEATLVGRVDMQVLPLRLQVAGQSGGERLRYVGTEHTADKDGQRAGVVEQVLGQQRLTLVGVAAHLPDGIGLAGGYVVLS